MASFVNSMRMDEVRQRMNALFRNMESLQHHDQYAGNFLVLENATEKQKRQFERYLQGRRLKCKVRHYDNAILVSELLGATHENAIGYCISRCFYMNRNALPHTLEQMHCTGSQDRILGDAMQQPDASFASGHFRCPNIVFEVAVAESLLSLVTACRNYTHNHNIRIIVGVKIYRRSQGDTDPMQLPMVFLVWFNPAGQGYNAQGVPDIAISFGTTELSTTRVNALLQTTGLAAAQLRGVGRGDPACRAYDLPEYVVNLGRDLLLEPHAGEAAYAPIQELAFDLFALQEEICAGTMDQNGGALVAAEFSADEAVSWDEND